MLWTGLDVSKDTINFAIPNPKKEGVFLRNGKINNNLKGFANLEKQLLDLNVKMNLACETTGIYSFPVMDYFSSRGWHANEIHAWSIAKYKQTVLQRNKTDKVDAKEISDYCSRYEDKLKTPYQSRTNELVELGLLMRMKVQLEKRDRAFKNIKEAYDFIGEERVENLKLDFASKGLEALVTENEKYKKNFKKGINDFTTQYFPEQYKVLSSIKGIGDGTIPSLIYYTNNFTRFSNGRDFGAYCGVVPNFYESGTSVKGKSKIANKAICNNALRVQMTQAATIAMRYNQQCMDLVARLSHLAYKQKLIAVTRKLCIQTYYCGSKLAEYDDSKS